MPRIYLIYAAEDHRFADMLLSQARASGRPVEFDRMLVKQPWVAKWKGQCRNLIRMSDGAVVLIGKKTHEADGVHWELECVRECGVPTLGVHIDKYEKGRVPGELSSSPVIDWDWAGISRFIESTGTGAAQAAG